MSCSTRIPIVPHRVRWGCLYTPYNRFLPFGLCRQLVAVYIDSPRKIVVVYILALVCRYTLHPLEVLGELQALRRVVRCSCFHVRYIMPVVGICLLYRKHHQELSETLVN